jgi:serine/threonine protein kinase
MTTPDPDSALRGELESALGPDYVLGRELGGGGMSRVYLAHDERLGRDVVVKVLEPEIAVQLSAERFTREIRLTAALQEPHIVPVLWASETAGGLPFYTMPFVRGESLRERLQRGAMSVRDAVATLRDIAKALAYAHAADVVHRDIKPENVLLSSGTAMVSDFGIARAVRASVNATSSALTVAGVAIGTPRYMAPEQAAGDPNIDHRADLYSWGVVAYETFAGQHPFAHRTTPRALLIAHIAEQPAPLVALRPDLPQSAVEIVMRCLEKEPDRRPQAATELLSALEPRSEWWTSTQPKRRLSAHTFSLSEPVLRRLDRELLDPRMLGSAMHYVENDAPAGVLLFCVHGLGHDSGDFTRLMESTPHRAIAPTLYGFEPVVDGERVPLPIDAHLALLRELLGHAIARLQPKHVVLVGFSSGADLVMRMLVDAPADAPKVDACLAMGPNLSLATCFVSRVFARLSSGDPRSLLADLQRLGADATDLDEWLNVMTYNIDSLRKFRNDITPLSSLASGIVRPFTRENEEAFARWFRDASGRVRVLRCVFERSPLCVSLVNALRLRHFDDGVLGPAYNEDSLVLERTGDHFALFDPERLETHVDVVVAGLR